MLVVGGLYALATHLPYRAPLVIGPTVIDASIPFIPSAALVYATYALLIPALIVTTRGRANFDHVYAVALLCGLTNVMLYNLVPTRIAERAIAPDHSLLALIQQLDTTLGAIPSGHVALPAAIATASFIVSRREHMGDATMWRRMATTFAMWTVALALSTLLTKQHVVVDVVAGLAFGPAVATFAVVSLRTARRRDLRSGVISRPALHRPTLTAFVREWIVIVLVVSVALRWWNAPLAAAAALIIATRQHAMLVLYHDGVHGLVARSRRVNDFTVNAAVGVPLVIPVHLYRAIHYSHHAHLGTDEDPERVLLYRGQPWAFRPLRTRALIGQLAGDVLTWNSVALVIRYVRERRTRERLKLPRTRAYPELVAQYTAFAAAIAAAFVLWPVVTLRTSLLWFLPYLTVTQLLQKIRSFAEHVTENIDPSLSCSWAPAVLGRLTIWPYNINYHREHHSHPTIPWDRLPAAFPSVEQRPGRDLIAHLWSGTSR
jgi:fatty acid desaturase